MKKTLTLVFALLALLAPAAFASEAELSEIQRPVDAVQNADEGTFALSAGATEEQPEMVEVYRHENI